ncbi:uncharacterized serine-rich protein C215.13 [Teleopsis dalmanni]|uniref:uncharacterized serine-rich protein C215.13 n=1 Tax=Teleopsis dalmanni TaxID=139649 RepID=UPI0018CE1E9E|nr:uncharacterized serine-rich protein C215.13 [Teleopsis dalmanni]XP_037937031.1 uncharacterized serine-rich protein C215.13 [Teleopsis dalmanni]XP_037937032.1 uncharacterized serine-rich protein C215.13 [Teleopsis dalmanni]
MSTTSSVETPTSPTGPLQPNQNHHLHTTTAIVVNSGTAYNHAITKRTHSSSSTNSNSDGAAVAPAPPITNNMNNTNVGNNIIQNHNQSTHSSLTLSSSTSSSPSVSASTSAAVHQLHSYSQYAARPTTSLSTSIAAVTNTVINNNTNTNNTTPNSIKRHTDVSVCSSSSSCCSSSGLVPATGVTVIGNSANAATCTVTPAVVNSGGSALITQKMSRTIPSDKINLRLILVSGKTKEFLFNPSDSAGDIAQTVFLNWPEDWEREAVSKAEILRLIYQGRFLHCNVTLGALGLPLGKTTVMHLVPRDNLPEPNSQDQRQKSKGGSSRCCSTTCCIL